MILPLLVVAQVGFNYSDNDGAFSLRAKEASFKQVQNGLLFDLSNGVTLNSRTKKITLVANNVRAFVVKSKGAKDPDSLQSAKANGNVKITQSASGVTANLQSKTATYTAEGEGGIVQASGSVRLQHVDSAKLQTLVATGASGSANLSPKAKRGISKALLNGPVRIDVVQTSNKNARMVFTGNKLTLEGNVIKLIGNVAAKGTGDSAFGSLSGADVMTGYLNDQGELKDWSVSSKGKPTLFASIQQGAPGLKIAYEDPAKSLRAFTDENGDFRVGVSENGDISVQLTGSPATVVSRLHGLTITANSITGSFDPPPKGHKTGHIKDLKVSGSARAAFDSSIRHATATEHHERYGTKEPEPRIGKDTATLTSDRFTFTGAAESGTFDIPQAFTMDLDSTGQRMVAAKATDSSQPAPKVPKDFHLISKFEGTSGQIKLNPAAEVEQDVLQTGWIKGPVTMTNNLTETSSLSPDPEVSRMTVHADRIDFDFVKERTVTLTDNIKMDGDGPTFSGSSTGDLAVLTVDPKTKKVLNIRITGNPTKSTLREKKKGGGR